MSPRAVSTSAQFKQRGNTMGEPVQQAVDALRAGVGHTMAQVGGWGAFISWLLSERGVALMGIVIGAAGLVIQWHYNRRRDRREQEEHSARMAMFAEH